MKQDMATPSCYAGVETRLNRWFEKFRRNRAKHEKASAPTTILPRRTLTFLAW
ncbi:unnamed protein product [Ectocarpus sp. CCAP 1310/34]|nr:unnamed protein product [Ectocarpus sp. CCAP 1310/34]